MPLSTGTRLGGLALDVAIKALPHASSPLSNEGALEICERIAGALEAARDEG